MTRNSSSSSSNSNCTCPTTACHSSRVRRLERPLKPATAGMQNGIAPSSIRTRCMRVFARRGADLHAQSALFNKKLLRRSSVGNFIESVLSVGNSW